MNFSKIIFSTLVLALFAFTGTTHAQLNLFADGSVGIGINSSNLSQAYVYNIDETYGLRNNTYTNAGGTKYAFRNYVGSQGDGYKIAFHNSAYQNSASNQLTYGQYNYTRAYGNSNGYGIYTILSNAGGTGNRYALYATISGAGYAGYFDGDLHVTGTFSSLVAPNSPQNQKMAKPMNATARISQLNTTIATNKAPGKAATTYALDLNSLKTAFPELVFEIEKPADQVQEEGADFIEAKGKPTIGTAVNYQSFIPVLIEAIKEQQKEIEALKTKVAQLEK